MSLQRTRAKWRSSIAHQEDDASRLSLAAVGERNLDAGLDGRIRDQLAVLWRQVEESVLAAMPAMPPHGVRVVKHKPGLGGTSCDVAKGGCAGRGEGGRDDNLGERRWLQHTPGKLVATIMSANRVGESLHQPGTVGPKRLFGGVRWKPEM